MEPRPATCHRSNILSTDSTPGFAAFPTSFSSAAARSLSRHIDCARPHPKAFSPHDRTHQPSARRVPRRPSGLGMARPPLLPGRERGSCRGQGRRGRRLRRPGAAAAGGGVHQHLPDAARQGQGGRSGPGSLSDAGRFPRPRLLLSRLPPAAGLLAHDPRRDGARPGRADAEIGRPVEMGQAGRAPDQHGADRRGRAIGRAYEIRLVGPGRPGHRRDLGAAACRRLPALGRPGPQAGGARRPDEASRDRGGPPLPAQPPQRFPRHEALQPGQCLARRRRDWSRSTGGWMPEEPCEEPSTGARSAGTESMRPRGAWRSA